MGAEDDIVEGLEFEVVGSAAAVAALGHLFVVKLAEFVVGFDIVDELSDYFVGELSAIGVDAA